MNGGDVILTLERPGGETKRISFSLDGTALYLADASDSAFRAQYLLVTPVDMNRLRTLAGGAA